MFVKHDSPARAGNAVAKATRAGVSRGDGAPHKSGARVRRTQRERSEQTRAALIDATIATVREQGYTAATLQTIARRAGVTSGALQHHFGSRGELLQAIVDRMWMDPSFEKAADLPPAQASLQERVDAWIDALWRLFTGRDYLALWDILFGARNDPQIFGQLRERQRLIVRRRVDQFLRTFPEAGLARAQAAVLVKLVSSQMRGLALLRLFGDPPAAHRKQLEIIRQVLYDDLARRVRDAATPAARSRRGGNRAAGPQEKTR